MQEDCWEVDEYIVGIFILPVARVCSSHYVFYKHIIELTGILSVAKTCELHSVFYWVNFEIFVCADVYKL